MSQQVQYGHDKDGKLVPSLMDPLSFLKNWFSEGIESQAGVAASANEAMISIEVPAGAVYMIFNIIASYFSTTSLAGRLVVYQSTTAAVGGTNVLLLDIMCNVDGTGLTQLIHLKGEKAPIAIVDNKEGSSSVYLNIEIARYVGSTVVANAITQFYSAAINGVAYT